MIEEELALVGKGHNARELGLTLVGEGGVVGERELPRTSRKGGCRGEGLARISRSGQVMRHREKGVAKEGSWGRRARWIWPGWSETARDKAMHRTIACRTWASGF